MDNLIKIVKEICNEENIRFSTASKDWVLVLEKDKKRRFIIGCKFDLNPYSSASLCDDKYATSDFLYNQHIPVVEEKIFYSSNNKEKYAEGCNSLEAAINLFHETNCDVVIKQNQGTGGKDIYHVKNEEMLTKKYEQLLEKYYSISIGPYYEIENEYRVIMLDYEPKLIYKKIKPVVIGDGIATKSELLKKFNPIYFNNKTILDDRVLANGETFEYNWKFNLAGGAKVSFEIEEGIRKKVIELAIEATKALNMRFCSVDVIKTVENKLFIMEVNTGVMMERFVDEIKDGHDLAKSIYKKAINKMFI